MIFSKTTRWLTILLSVIGLVLTSSIGCSVDQNALEKAIQDEIDDHTGDESETDGGVDIESGYSPQEPGPNGPVTAITPTESGGVIVAGDFDQYNGVKVPGIVKVDKDGEIDEAFVETVADAQADGTVREITENDDGSLSLYGDFYQFAGQPVKNVVSIQPSGEVVKEDDPLSFDRPVSGAIQTAEGETIVYGDFEESSILDQDDSNARIALLDNFRLPASWEIRKDLFVEIAPEMEKPAGDSTQPADPSHDKSNSESVAIVDPVEEEVDNEDSVEPNYESEQTKPSIDRSVANADSDQSPASGSRQLEEIVEQDIQNDSQIEEVCKDPIAELMKDRESLKSDRAELKKLRKKLKSLRSENSELKQREHKRKKEERALAREKRKKQRELAKEAQRIDRRDRKSRGEKRSKVADDDKKGVKKRERVAKHEKRQNEARQDRQKKERVDSEKIAIKKKMQALRGQIKGKKRNFKAKKAELAESGCKKSYDTKIVREGKKRKKDRAKARKRGKKNRQARNNSGGQS